MGITWKRIIIIVTTETEVNFLLGSLVQLPSTVFHLFPFSRIHHLPKVSLKNTWVSPEATNITNSRRRPHAGLMWTAEENSHELFFFLIPGVICFYHYYLSHCIKSLRFPILPSSNQNFLLSIWCLHSYSLGPLTYTCYLQFTLFTSSLYSSCCTKCRSSILNHCPISTIHPRRYLLPLPVIKLQPESDYSLSSHASARK